MPRSTTVGFAVVAFALAADSTVAQVDLEGEFTKVRVNRYVAGDYDGAATELAEFIVRQPHPGSLVGRLRTTVGEYPPAIGATLALELTDALWRRGNGAAAQQFFELAQDFANKDRIEPAWRLSWYEAAAAMLQGPAGAGSFYAGANNDWPGPRHGAASFLKQALGKYENSGALALAAGIASERALFVWSKTGTISWDTNPATAGGVFIRNPGGGSDFRWIRGDLVTIRGVSRAYADARSNLEHARRIGDGRVRTLATLHLGSVLAYRRKFEEAQGLWLSLQENPDEDVRFLAYLFAGKSCWAQGRAAEAIRLVAAAHTIHPYAQSAAVTLAGYLFTNGQVELASGLVEQVLNAPLEAMDPVQTYFRGDYDRWARLLSELRGSLG